MVEKEKNQLIETISKMTLLEMADLVKALEEKFQISATMPIVSSGGATESSVKAGTQEEEKTEYKVTLANVGSEKIKVIKVLRQLISTLTLSDIRQMINEVPALLVESVSKEEAIKMKKKIRRSWCKSRTFVAIVMFLGIYD